MNFGDAINACIQNKKRIARTGWNGKGMFLASRPGYPEGVKLDESTAESLGRATGETVVFGPYIVIKSADGSVYPWLASQADMHAEDWVIVL
jgi:hypothetical protein